MEITSDSLKVPWEVPGVTTCQCFSPPNGRLPFTHWWHLAHLEIFEASTRWNPCDFMLLWGKPTSTGVIPLHTRSRHQFFGTHVFSCENVTVLKSKVFQLWIFNYGLEMFECPKTAGKPVITIIADHPVEVRHEKTEHLFGAQWAARSSSPWQLQNGQNGRIHKVRASKWGLPSARILMNPNVSVVI